MLQQEGTLKHDRLCNFKDAYSRPLITGLKSCSRFIVFSSLDTILKNLRFFPIKHYPGMIIVVAMIVPTCLALWSIFAFCPFVSALTLSLYNVTSPNLAFHNSSGFAVGVNPNVHCTKDPNWLVPSYPNILSYDYMCQNAMASAIRELYSHGPETEFEFLDRGASAQTTRPQIQLPRKYVASEYCDVGKHN